MSQELTYERALELLDQKLKALEDGDLSLDEALTAVDEARIRLQFTSPTKPALITGSTGNGDEPTPDYRYLVVPLRALAGA